MVREITSAAEFASAKNVPNLVVVDYYATWCGPCMNIAPFVEQLAGKYPDVVFLKVGEHNCQDVIMSAGIRAFPTFQFFINGNKVDEMKGASPQALENKVLGHKDKAGVSAFSGQGSALGGAAPAWDGVGMPPGTNDRMARLAKFGHIDEKKRSENGSSMDSKPVSVAAPQGVLRSSDQDDDDEEAAIARAIALSMAASDAPSSAIAVDASRTMDEMEIANDGDDDMVPVPVNEDHLSQLLEMGIPDVRARKGLVHGQTVEGAVSWIAEHQEDADIDQEYLVRRKDALPKAPLSAEEKAARIQAMKDKAARIRREQEEKEKQDAITREKERRMRGQLLSETQEERERMLRKLEADKIKREKQEEKREKERLRAQIAADKEERRRHGGMLPSALGVEGYNPSAGGYGADSGSVSSGVSSASTTAPQKSPEEIIEASIGTISRYRTGGDGGNALKLLALFMKNIVDNPTEEKYRAINTESKAFKGKLAPLVGPVAVLKAVGFVNGDDGKLHFKGDDLNLIASTLEKITQAEEEYRQKNPAF